MTSGDPNPDHIRIDITTGEATPELSKAQVAQLEVALVELAQADLDFGLGENPPLFDNHDPNA